MLGHSDRTLLAKRLKGQRLFIPDMWPIFASWPCQIHEDYERMRESIGQDLVPLIPSEKHRKAVSDADPALLAARWWPTIKPKQYHVMTLLIIWFGIWDDQIEKLSSYPIEAQNLRIATKSFIRHSLALDNDGDKIVKTSNTVIVSFKRIADEVLDACNEDQRKTLGDHFERYIDATVLEAEADRRDDIPSLKRYWEIRTLTSGMGILLGMSEFALQVKLPPTMTSSIAYETLWVTTIVINSIVNDLLSLKKEMRDGSVLSSVAILFHQLGDLGAAVQTSVQHLSSLVTAFDDTASALLSSLPSVSGESDAVAKVIDLMRMVNTGNLKWSLEAKRYGVQEYMTGEGHIDLVL